MRSVLCDALDRGGFETFGVGTAADARDAMHSFDPDLVVIDLDLGAGPSGADLGSALVELHPDVALLYLTRLPDFRPVGGTAPVGASRVGFVRKDTLTSTDDFVEAAERVIRGIEPPPRDDLDPDRPLAALSATQFDILRLAAEGLSNQAIARRRSTTASAVEAHFTAINRALGIAAGPDTNSRSLAVSRFIAAVGRLADEMPVVNGTG